VGGEDCDGTHGRRGKGDVKRTPGKVCIKKKGAKVKTKKREKKGGMDRLFKGGYIKKREAKGENKQQGNSQLEKSGKNIAVAD